MRHGFTTGSCAAAAAKAATLALLTGVQRERVSIETPGGKTFDAQIVDYALSAHEVSCAVIKDGGDDPDVTTGAHITATVTRLAEKEDRIYIDGGFGVGRVTAPGLDQPVGAAAINHVPREMIEEAVREIGRLCDFQGTLRVIISVPEGEALAGKTFNPRLGIVGGISILGTSGIVEPMSAQALKDTIRVELRQKRAQGHVNAAVTPGNYGLDFMKEAFDFDLDRSVKCSNFIGETVDMAAELGFDGLLLTGHVGKLIKLSGGIMNTHSHEADCRMELLAMAAIMTGCEAGIAREMMGAVATEEALRILREQGEDALQKAMDYAMERILFFLRRRGPEQLQIECMMYSKEFGLLAASDGAREMLEAVRRQESRG
ncbi:MAG: cobalt-precorrin-5B (C(1))-methyltransferase CbiD [Lachnospiraceae bacterium]|nr:cobalt-precorrin-5B (C(1))-methyltransferase CbiD [Lachnospiraceae bacterium]